MKTKALLVIACLSLTSCAGLENALNEASAWDEEHGEGLWQMAQLACARQHARSRSLSIEEAKDKFCSTAEQLESWKDVLLRAERAGAVRAGLQEE